MKKIKYLSDGTIAKAGMRVEVKSRVLGNFTGVIASLSSDGWLDGDIGLEIKPDSNVECRLYKEKGIIWTHIENCTPIK